MKKVLLAVFVILLFAITACAPSATATPTPRPTRAATATPPPTETPVPEPPTETPVPEPPTPIPAPPTPTPVPPVATAKLIVNVRGGPGTTYPVLGKLKKDEQKIITGKSEDGKYWQIDFNGQPGWIAADFTTVDQPTDNVPVVAVQPPPQPTKKPTSAVTPTPKATPTAAVAQPFGVLAFVRQLGDGSFIIDHYNFADKSTAAFFNIGPFSADVARVASGMAPMAWSKDSAFLAYVFGQSGSLNDLRLYNVASDLTSKLYSCEGLASPSFSPDATQIAFVCYENGFANRDILILTVGQRTQIKVYGEPGVFIRGVAWGKNNQLALVTDKSGHDEIYLLNAFNPGGTPAQLTNTKGASLSPAWSPDGTKIAFTSNRDGADKIYVMNADGSDARALHDGSAPSWSPDGQWIAFQLSGNIFIMDAFGGHVTQITNDGGANPAWSR